MRRMAHVEGLAGIETAVAATGVVQGAGVPASLWVAGPGSVPGSVAWSVAVESFAEWASYTDKLAADAAYNAFSRENVGSLTMTVADTLAEIVYGEIAGQSEVGDYIGSMEATINPGNGPAAAAFAVEVADAFTETTGLVVAVVKNFAGDQATLGWLVRYGAAATVDESEAKIAASSDYAAVLAKGDGLFTGGTQLIARRAA